MALVEIDNENVQKIIHQALNDIIQNLEDTEENTVKPSYFFMKLFINNCLDFALEYGGCRTKLFFELVNETLCKTNIA